MKKCPFCAEEIQDEALVCRYCGRDLAPQAPAPPRSRTTPYLYIAVAALIVLRIAPIWPSDWDVIDGTIAFTGRLGLTRYPSFGVTVSNDQLDTNLRVNEAAQSAYDALRWFNLVASVLAILIASTYLLRSRYSPTAMAPIFLIGAGVALVFFPLLNLIISWNLFVNPGPIASILVAGLFIYCGSTASRQVKSPSNGSA